MDYSLVISHQIKMKTVFKQMCSESHTNCNIKAAVSQLL